ncbi:MAG TPA: hypothetical protein DGG94_14880 [Micromonosporaceae bacterium]|nr:hypothetical protein [Micromonosporaceae bacterium]HCU51057.1 hypothetical protein [Micromonosporaceae bacterium]
MRARTAVTALVLLILVFGLGGYLARQHLDGGLSIPESLTSCAAQGDDKVRLDPEQMANASTVAAVGIRRSVPDRAIVVALAAALQESKLRNLEDLGRRNDHDSIGLFQQRPSQGWGTPEQILDPRYATERFYTALLKVKGWQQMRVTDAAQEVQRSAYPEAYEKWADEASVLTLALTGQAVGAITCSDETTPAKIGPDAAKDTAEKLRQDFGTKAPKVVTDQHMLRVPAKDSQTGWQLAHWLVAQAKHTGVTKVSFADQEWSAKSGQWSAVQKATDQVTAEVRADD